MATGTPFLTEEMRQKAVGTVSGPAVLEVEKGAIKRFAEAVGDANPLWNDEASARKSRFGGILGTSHLPPICQARTSPTPLRHPL